ncbi:MAG: hypothetical protein II897_04200 [Clostridia bacterium]|nr:hypothetical protein [Clostridia bacterium]
MYVIRGKHPDRTKWEDIDECEDRDEAERLLQEYKMAFRGTGILLHIKVRSEK